MHALDLDRKSMAAPGALVVEPLTPTIGAEIHGVDLSGPLPAQTIADIRAALARHGVVFFRGQQLTPQQHVDLAERFAPINVNRFFRAVPGFPMIGEVRKDPEHKRAMGNNWHTDHSYDLAPALGSILVARELPRAGGDTLFASMSAAYDALSDGLKRTLRGLRALHSSRHVFGPGGRNQSVPELSTRIGNPEAATQDAVHPVVIRHPDSGRPTLFVNPSFTVRFEGWTDEESRSLLDYLCRHALRPDFQCRFTWAPGSVAFWDNRATWHFAVNDYQGERRLMHRITIEGVPLEAAAD